MIIGYGTGIWQPFLLVSIFWQKTKKNWHFLDQKTKEKQKKNSALYIAKSLPK